MSLREETVVAVRGATTIESDCEAEIREKTVELMRALLEKNMIDGTRRRIVSILFSLTQDIRSFYPARALREGIPIDAPLFSCVEPDISGGLPLCIRVLVMLTVQKDDMAVRPVYLHGAASLRPDLIETK